jgi:phosphomannomutase/phosphoglucomutase
MAKINPTIFKTYDVRGVVDKELSEDVAGLIGKGFGTYLRDRGTSDVLVARDTRATSESYQNNLVDALLSTGCDVYDMGIALTSNVYFARQYYKIDGAVVVTASHSPALYNGFKFCHGFNTISGEEIQKVRKIIESGSFKTGKKGKVKDLREAVSEYYKQIRERSPIKKPLKVVVDYGNGTPALFITKLLEDYGCEAVPIFDKVDPTFPNHIPDPVLIKAYDELIKKVKAARADVGVLFDGDGDRAGFVDEKGQIWLGDMILALLARDYLPKFPGSKVIVELKDSEIVYEDVKRLGGKPIFWKTGHSLLDEKVFKEKAILCGEMSCHYWITPNWYFFDDAVYAMVNVLRIIAQSGKKFSDLMEEIPKYPSTPEYRVAVPANEQLEITKKAVDYFKEKCDRYLDIDGIRGYKHNGWFLIRSSNTQPLITVRVEAKTEQDLEKLKNFVKEGVDKIPNFNLDWNRQYDIT